MHRAAALVAAVATLGAGVPLGAQQPSRPGPGSSPDSAARGAALPTTSAIAAPDAAADTVPTLRWRLLARALVREVQSRRSVAQQAASRGDSTALHALPTMSALNRANLLRAIAYHVAADSARRDAARPSVRAAAAAAAASLLRRGFPEAAARIDQELARDSAAERAAGVSAERVAAGLHVGRIVANQVLERAKDDGWDRGWTGTIPTGAGMWRSANGNAVGNANVVMRRAMLLDSISQFRPAPPPAFGTAAFDSALTEVREVARARTAEQTRIAQRWGTVQDPWHELVSDFIAKYRVPEEIAMRVQTVLALGGADTEAACWEAKMHYWTLRPSQADSTIPLAEKLTLPNFPAYPSGHGCGAGFFSEVVGHYVPQARDEARRLAEEGAMSRLYAGVHYRFDNDAGLELGRKIARFAIEQEERGTLLRRWR